ncbi:MAG: PilZ domain-containing protein [Candidatus Aceula meridiana]|nr:PilZ domain-containing protein [Candidatus Aceula meridiana]
MDRPEERRKHLRVSKHFIVTYYDANIADAQHNVSQLKDISQGGVCFSSCAGFPKNSLLQILIKTPYLAETLSIKGIVVDCAEKIPEVIYEIHVQLEGLTPETELILKKIEKNFIESQRNQY